MTDNPLRGSDGQLSPVGLPYSPPPPPTSKADGRVRIALVVLWLLMFVPGLVYVDRYALRNPYVDEWSFVPVLFGERPAGPWLWELHNEHRFPLPRLVYLGLFRLTGDLRAGCLVSFLGISLVAAGLMRLARIVRGRPHLADGVFPLLLMHTGQGENLYMGYQLAFMLTTGLACALLAVIVTTNRPQDSNHFRRGLQAAVLGWLLLACGAAGLAYGIAAAVWVVLLAVTGRMTTGGRLVLMLSAPVTPYYIAAYFQGYARPAHHPPSAGVVESVRIGLEAQAMAFGPAATGLWPAVGVALLLAALGLIGYLVWGFIRHRDDLRLAGLLLYLGAGAAIAFGIGWGRSGFMDDMGFAWRYGWITVPFVFGAYFTLLVRDGRVSIYGTCALGLMAVAIAPVNMVSGFLNGENQVRRFEAVWEADVRAGRTAEDVVRKNLPDYRDPARRDVVEAMRLMRDRHYAYYESLGREGP